MMAVEQRNITVQLRRRGCEQYCPGNSSDSPSREVKTVSLCDFARHAGAKTHSFRVLRASCNGSVPSLNCCLSGYGLQNKAKYYFSS